MSANCDRNQIPLRTLPFRVSSSKFPTPADKDYDLITWARILTDTNTSTEPKDGKTKLGIFYSSSRPVECPCPCRPILSLKLKFPARLWKPLTKSALPSPSRALRARTFSSIPTACCSLSAISRRRRCLWMSNSDASTCMAASLAALSSTWADDERRRGGDLDRDRDRE